MNAICINLNDIDTFKLSISLADKSVFDYKWLIFREDKLGTDDTELIKCLSEYNLDFTIIHSEILDKLVEEKCLTYIILNYISI